jgi:hypothetical protein
MDWVSVKGASSAGGASGAGGTGAVTAGREAQEKIPGRMIIRRSKTLRNRGFIFIYDILYNQCKCKSNKLQFETP